jgi:hypothetical protein
MRKIHLAKRSEDLTRQKNNKKITITKKNNINKKKLATLCVVDTSCKVAKTLLHFK